MAKGKLTKLKSVLKKWNSFSSSSSTTTTNNIKRSTVVSNDESNSSSSSPLALELRPVFVGKTRRRYLLSSDVVGHPLFQELVEKSDDKYVEELADKVYVACEVVLFEHLLWMIENADPKPESFDELAEFYAC
ncbi:hypothetical protein RIF29_09235 [Crotalaria pallida]|uniref:Uncharacterized protein n=1 Tax=Crotalaria pallida TaxID=3830 RepID=A0AAN9FZD0_CROPI